MERRIARSVLRRVNVIVVVKIEAVAASSSSFRSFGLFLLDVLLATVICMEF